MGKSSSQLLSMLPASPDTFPKNSTDKSDVVTTTHLSHYASISLVKSRRHLTTKIIN
jgi:hypothetical protein